MAHRIEIKIRSENHQQRYQIEIKEGQELTIGRGNCSITLDDPKLSREHLMLLEDGEGLLAKDLESRNGCQVNGEKFETHRVHTDDVVRIGSHKIHFAKIEPIKESPVKKEKSAESDLDNYLAERRSDPSYRIPAPSHRSSEVVQKESSFSGIEQSREAPDRAPDRLPEPEKIPDSVGFAFLPYRKFRLKEIVRFWKYAAKNWKTVWQHTNFHIPIEDSLWVTWGIGIVYSLIFGAVSILSQSQSLLVIIPIVVYGGLITFCSTQFLAGIHFIFRGFLGAKGSFDEYLAFFTYAAFFYLPIVLVAALVPIFGILLCLPFQAWICWGFAKSFKIVGKKYALFAIGLLAVAVVLASPLLFVASGFEGAMPEGEVAPPPVEEAS